MTVSTANAGQTIAEHEPIKVKISDITFDEANPNQLTEEQMHGLREAMRRFGYLQPIIVDQNNKIADGEHRLLVYKEFNQTEIPAYRVTFENDNERRLLRQAMNKIRGQHDPKLDLEEINILMHYDRLALEEMLQIDGDRVKEIENIAKVPTREDWNQLLAEGTNFKADGLGDLHQVQLKFTQSEFDLFNAAMTEIKPYKENDNTSLKVIKMVNEWRVMRQQYQAEMESATPPPPVTAPATTTDLKQ